MDHLQSHAVPVKDLRNVDIGLRKDGEEVDVPKERSALLYVVDIPSICAV
jgi:hypothetical protein